MYKYSSQSIKADETENVVYTFHWYICLPILFPCKKKKKKYIINVLVTSVLETHQWE